MNRNQNSMVITDIHLRNIRAFSDLKLNFTNNGKIQMSNILIGRNGTCKSTVLRCIAMAFCSNNEIASLLTAKNGSYVRIGENYGEIEVFYEWQGKGKSRRIILTPSSSGNYDELSFDHHNVSNESREPYSEYFVRSIGAGRNDSSIKSPIDYRVSDTVRPLFSHDAGMLETGWALYFIKDHMKENVFRKWLNKVSLTLGLEEDSVKFDKGKLIFSSPEIGQGIPLEGLADGYRMTTILLIDVIAWSLLHNPDHLILNGILLIDEIEQHIHPSLQTKIIPRLRKFFPNMQIIASTHSPLVPLGLESGSLYSLQRNEDEILVNRPEFEAYSVEDMLTAESLFDADVYSPEYTEKLDQHAELLKKKNRTKAESTKLAKLGKELNSLQMLDNSESKFDELYQKIISEAKK